MVQDSPFFLVIEVPVSRQACQDLDLKDLLKVLISKIEA